MKSSLVILCLLLFNTTAIFSEQISLLIEGIDTWVLVVLELILVVSYYLNNILKDINKTFQMEFNNLNFYPKKREE